MGDLIFPGRHNENHREREFPGDVVDWDRGSSGVEAKGEPWEHPGNERGNSDRGTSLQEGPWDRGRVLWKSVEPWEEDRGAGKTWETGLELRTGNTQGERLRESIGKEKINK